MPKKALGKGLNALLPSAEFENQSFIINIDLNKIEPNIDQPRKDFNEETILELAESIKEVGVIQPIIVSDEGSFYRIIAGERRWRASRIAGLTEIPVIIKNISKEQSMEISLIENIQRQDLNPIEEALGYERLMTEFHYTQEKLSKVVGKSRPTISNAIRLLKLSDNIRQKLSSGELSAGHARALLSLSSDEAKEFLADKILQNELNVRQSESLAKELSSSTSSTSVNTRSSEEKVLHPSSEKDLILQQIESSLQNLFNTNVVLRSQRGKGKILIEFYCDDDLQRILDKLGVKLS